MSKISSTNPLLLAHTTVRELQGHDSIDILHSMLAVLLDHDLSACRYISLGYSFFFAVTDNAPYGYSCQCKNRPARQP